MFRVYLVKEWIDQNGGAKEELLVNASSIHVLRKFVMHWSDQSVTMHVRSVEKSVQIVQQLIPGSQGLHRCFGHFRMTNLSKVCRILVLSVDRIMRPTKRIVGAQLKPTTTQFRVGLSVETTDIGTSLVIKSVLTIESKKNNHSQS